jgi:hypothetical protein
MRRIIIYGVCLSIAVAAVVLGFDLLIETDEERIEKLLDDMRSAASSGNPEQLVPLLDLEGDGFEVAVGRDREKFAAGDLEALEEWIGDGLAWIGDASLRLDSTTVTISGSHAHAYFRAVLGRSDGDDQTIPIDLTLRRSGDAWLATRFRALTAGSPRAARR